MYSLYSCPFYLIGGQCCGVKLLSTQPIFDCAIYGVIRSGETEHRLSDTVVTIFGHLSDGDKGPKWTSLLLSTVNHTRHSHMK